MKSIIELAREAGMPIDDDSFIFQATRERVIRFAALVRAAALEELPAEPVAWMYFDSDGDAIFGHPNGYRPDDAVPVYTAPQPDDTALLRQALEALEFAAENVFCEQDDDLIGVARRALQERLQ